MRFALLFTVFLSVVTLSSTVTAQDIRVCVPPAIAVHLEAMVWTSPDDHFVLPGKALQLSCRKYNDIVLSVESDLVHHGDTVTLNAKQWVLDEKVQSIYTPDGFKRKLCFDHEQFLVDTQSQGDQFRFHAYSSPESRWTVNINLSGNKSQVTEVMTLGLYTLDHAELVSPEIIDVYVQQTNANHPIYSKGFTFGKYYRTATAMISGELAIEDFMNYFYDKDIYTVFTDFMQYSPMPDKDEAMLLESFSALLSKFYLGDSVRLRPLIVDPLVKGKEHWILYQGFVVNSQRSHRYLFHFIKQEYAWSFGVELLPDAARGLAEFIKTGDDPENPYEVIQFHAVNLACLRNNDTWVGVSPVCADSNQYALHKYMSYDETGKNVLVRSTTLSEDSVTKYTLECQHRDNPSGNTIRHNCRENAIQFIREHTLPAKTLFYSDVFFTDLTNDGKKEAVWFVVANGELVSYACLTLNTGQINPIQHPITAQKIKALPYCKAILEISR